MNTVQLISPTFFSQKADVLQLIEQSDASLIVLPCWVAPAADETSAQVFEYPSVAELQAVLSKGQRLFCQEQRPEGGKPPKNLLITRKDTLSLGRSFPDEEILANPNKFGKRLQKRRSIELNRHRVAFVFGEEINVLGLLETEALDHIDLLIYPISLRPSHWLQLSKSFKKASQLTSLAYTACHDGNNPKSLPKSRASIKLLNAGVENIDAATWDKESQLYWLDVPLDD